MDCERYRESIAHSGETLSPMFDRLPAPLRSIEDPDQRIAMLTQILEFGQTPRQLFSSPHPQRMAPRFLAMTRSPSSGSAASELCPGRVPPSVGSLERCAPSPHTPLWFAASPCGDSSFEDLTEESRRLGWANMGNLEPVHRHRVHKE